MLQKSTMFKQLFFIIFLALTSLSAIAKDEQSFSITEKDFVDTIKISYHHHSIYVPVTIDGKTFQFVFDTGASAFIISDSLKDLLTESDKKIKFSDFNKNVNKVNTYKIPAVTMGNIHLNDVTSIIMKGEGLANMIDGVIGAGALFKYGLLTKISLKDSILIITDRKDFFDSENGQTMNCDSNRKCPHVQFSMSHGKGGDLMFDTGCNSFMNINRKYYDKALKSKEKELFKQQIEWVDTGSIRYSVFGLEKPTEHIFMKLKEVRIDSLCFNDVPTEVADGYTVIGCRILEYGSIIVNPTTHTLTYQPYNDITNNIHIKEKPMDYGSMFVDGKIVVVMINTNSDVYRQGLRKGDYLIEHNGVTINSLGDLKMARIATEHLETYPCKFRNSNGETKEIIIEKN